MAALSKTAAISLISLQQIASNTVVVSSAQDVSTKFGVSIYIHLGRDDTGGALTEGVEFRVEASAKTTGNDQWYPVSELKSNVTLPEAELLTAGLEDVGATVLELASTTNLAVNDQILIKNTTIGNSEWSRIIALVANTSITIEPALTRVQTGSTVYDQAQPFFFDIDCENIVRLRLVVNAANTGRTIVVEAFMVTSDSIA